MAAAALTGPSCGSWVRLPDHHISILAVDRLNRGEEFTFTVNITSMSGQALKKVEYDYRIDWVGVEGGTYKGRSGILQKIRVKGGPGTATLHILGYDAQDNFGEVAKYSFEVQ
jgi:hypothetical protein